MVEELVAAEDLPGRRSEIGEEVELAVGERESRLTDAHLAASSVDEQVAETQAVLCRTRAGPSGHGPHPRHELGEGDGLHEVVVGAEVEPGDAVALLPPSAHH